MNGPKLIGCGLLICSISSIMSGLPYFIYGPATHLLMGNDLQPDPARSAMLGAVGAAGAAGLGPGAAGSAAGHGKVEQLLGANHEFCPAGQPNCQENPHPFALGAFLILVVASFVNGIGASSVRHAGRVSKMRSSSICTIQIHFNYISKLSEIRVQPESNGGDRYSQFRLGIFPDRVALGAFSSNAALLEKKSAKISKEQKPQFETEKVVNSLIVTSGWP